MLRRTVVGSVLTAMFFPFAASSAAARQVLTAGGMRFDWRHVDGRFVAILQGPTSGWIAVGFNERRRLAGTRFVIAHVSTGEALAELHHAEVPTHRNVTEFGAKPDLRITDHGYDGHVSRLAFTLPLEGRGAHSLSLTPGTESYVMLAWSHARDFEHHSAWRGHFDVIL